MESTRASLILRLQNADDVAAWDEFSAIYAPVVYRVAIARGLQAADAENLVQEVMLSVARSVDQWLERTNRGSFRAWLLRISRNAAVDILPRRATRVMARGGDSADQLLAELPAADNVSQELDLEYDRAVFQWAAIQVRDVVADSTWDAFRLTSIDGVCVTDAAEQLQMRPGNVYLARSRVMTRIRELVKQYEVES